MLKMGIQRCMVKHALKKDKKDLYIAKIDPEKLWASKIKNKAPSKAYAPLKDNPEHATFFEILWLVFSDFWNNLNSMFQLIMWHLSTIGWNVRAYQILLLIKHQNIQVKDPNIIDMNPEKPMGQQWSKSKQARIPEMATKWAPMWL